MKKTAIIATALVGALALGGGSAYAAGQIARSNAIGEDTARNFAYVDAGVLPGDANVSRTEFDFEKGKFVYEIDFTANGVRYEYTVDSSDGKVLEKESEPLLGSAKTTTAPTAVQSTTQPETTAEPDRTVTQSNAPFEQQTPQTAKHAPAKSASEPTASPKPETSTAASRSETISVEEAKSIALQKAGRSAGEVVFSKARLEYDDGKRVYDISFYIAGETEYDYEIDAYTGAVLDEDVEPWELFDD